MFSEASHAAEAVSRQAECPALRAAAAALVALDPPLILTCARGSSDHAATYMQYLAPMFADIPCFSQPPSLGSVLHATSRRLKGAAMLLISQSGHSPDLLRSAEAARAAGMRLFGLINDTSSPLAAMVDHLVPLHAGPEYSVAATKSVIATLAALLRLLAIARNDRRILHDLNNLPNDLHDAWNQNWSAASAPMAAADHLFVLGRDLTQGVAGEIALKCKETAGLHAEAFSIAEVAHGPMALIGPNVPVLAFPSHAVVRAASLDLLASFRDRGATVMVVGEDLDGAIPLAMSASGQEVRPLLALQSAYRLVEAVAQARHRDPDSPPSLRKVTKTL